jgi:type II secretory pathway component PulF
MEMSKDDPPDAGQAGKIVERRFTRYRLVAHAIAWGLCLGVFVFVVPTIEAIFNDFNLPLPRKTIFVISSAHWIIRHQRSIVVGLILVLPAAEWLMLLARSEHGGTDLSWRWSVLMFATPLVVTALTLIALGLPLFCLCNLRLTG